MYCLSTTKIVGITCFSLESYKNTRTNHNYRPCRWYAPAPLGPFTSRAYRLIEFSFACVWCPTIADAIRCAPRPPCVKGTQSPHSGDWGIATMRSIPPSRLSAVPPPFAQGRHSAAAGLGIAKAFWNPQPCWGFSCTTKTGDS